MQCDRNINNISPVFCHAFFNHSLTHIKSTQSINFISKTVLNPLELNFSKGAKKFPAAPLIRISIFRILSKQNLSPQQQKYKCRHQPWFLWHLLCLITHLIWLLFLQYFFKFLLIYANFTAGFGGKRINAVRHIKSNLWW